MRIERALVTGASAGIGLAIARDLAGRGADLVVVARDEARLRELAAELGQRYHTDVEVLPADLSVDADRRRVEQRVVESPTVDCVVNNAGFGTFGPLAGSDADAEQAVVEVNVTALTRLTQVAAMTFAARGRGAILNVSSLGGFQPNPGHAVYGATKAFVTSLTEAVHEELRDRGVHVTALCPGYTRTEFHERSSWSVGGLPEAAWSSAEDVARIGIDGLLRNRAIVVPGTSNSLLAAGAQVLPSGLTRRVASRLIRSGDDRV